MKYEDHYLIFVLRPNAKRQGSASEKRMRLLRNGMTVSQARKTLRSKLGAYEAAKLSLDFTWEPTTSSWSLSGIIRCESLVGCLEDRDEEVGSERCEKLRAQRRIRKEHLDT